MIYQKGQHKNMFKYSNTSCCDKRYLTLGVLTEVIKSIFDRYW